MANNIIYLMKDEKRDFCLYKVGYTHNLAKRTYAYTTANPLTECISTVQTQERSGRKVEKAFHDEIATRGYRFITARIDGKRTEWFAVPYSDPFHAELSAKGLNAFKCGRNRKDCGAYTK